MHTVVYAFIVNTMKRNLRRKNKTQRNVHEWKKNRQNDECNPMLFLSVQRIHMSKIRAAVHSTRYEKKKWKKAKEAERDRASEKNCFRKYIL